MFNFKCWYCQKCFYGSTPRSLFISSFLSLLCGALARMCWSDIEKRGPSSTRTNINPERSDHERKALGSSVHTWHQKRIRDGSPVTTSPAPHANVHVGHLCSPTANDVVSTQTESDDNVCACVCLCVFVCRGNGQWEVQYVWSAVKQQQVRGRQRRRRSITFAFAQRKECGLTCPRPPRSCVQICTRGTEEETLVSAGYWLQCY